MTTTTKEIIENTYMRNNSVGKLFIENPDTLWYSQSDFDQLRKELKEKEKMYQRCAKNIKSNINKDKTLSGTKIRELHIAYNDAVSKIELLQEILLIFDKFSQLCVIQ